jgi:hypothetical protein
MMRIILRKVECLEPRGGEDEDIGYMKVERKTRLVEWVEIDRKTLVFVFVSAVLK